MSRMPYPSDLTDAQWEIVKRAMPPARNGRTGEPRRYPLREMWDAIFYKVKNGCTWRALPHDFPPHSVVWQQYLRWRDNGTLTAARSSRPVAGKTSPRSSREDSSTAISL